MVKNLKKEKAILADQTDAKRADCHTYSFMQIVSTHVPFSRVCDKISIIIEASWNANLFQLLLVLFHFIFTITIANHNHSIGAFDFLTYLSKPMIWANHCTDQ